jgi:hypothetical protein
MNERIKQLAIQAGVYVGDDMWFADELNPKTQMFAQLIVRECIAQIAEAIPDTNCSASSSYKTAKIAAMSRVRTHFGVKD